jgi:hypothetical protein
MKNISQEIPPIDNSKKIISTADIEYRDIQYFKHCGEEFEELYKNILKRADLYINNSPFDILNNILDLFILELKRDEKNSNNKLVINHISNLKKEMLLLLDKFCQNDVDMIKLLAIIRAYIKEL